MKKILAVLIVLCLLGGLAFAQKAQWVAAKTQYALEPGAKLRIGIDNDKWGAAVVALWDKIHPEAAGMVTYVNFGSAGGTDQITSLQGEAPDVCLVIDGEVARNVQSLMTIDSVMAGVGKNNTPATFFNNANPSKVTFIPVAYDGMAFAWNKTMMDALKLDTKDANGDGLPDAYDSWEKIFDLSKKWQTARPEYNKAKINIVYPICLDEVWSAYSNVTGAGWEIFKEGDPLKPGFEKPEFAKGLEFIKAASDAMLSVEANGVKTPAASMTWRWDDMLNNQTAPFGLVGTWMDVNAAEAKGGYDIKFSALPTWNKKSLTPFVKTKGFSINGFTKFPSAAHELLRLLYTKDGTQAMIDNSSYIPALAAKSSIAPSYAKDLNKQEMSAAFASNYPEPAMTLPANKAKKGMDVYYGIGMNLIYRAVWDGEKTPAQAQAEAVRLATQWYADNNK